MSSSARGSHGRPRRLTLDEYSQGIDRGDRGVLARAITLVESGRAADQELAQALLGRILPRAGGGRRIAVTGAPGAGKSTFIESLGNHLVETGHRVAVLAIDPSSQLSGGSVLGDKTRMTDLGRHPGAFIRPSPSGGSLGGVAGKTRESMLLCEAAGFDVILVETVGVGQSETAASQMVDFFLLLLLPGSGDALQGIKRGILELADLVVVTKADGQQLPVAERTRREYEMALHVARPARAAWTPEVLTCSAIGGQGVAEIWERISRYFETMTAAGEIARLRQDQMLRWMWSLIDEGLSRAFRRSPQVSRLLPGLEKDVLESRKTPTAAAQEILNAFGALPPA